MKPYATTSCVVYKKKKFCNEGNRAFFSSGAEVCKGGALFFVPGKSEFEQFHGSFGCLRTIASSQTPPVLVLHCLKTNCHPQSAPMFSTAQSNQPAPSLDHANEWRWKNLKTWDLPTKVMVLRCRRRCGVTSQREGVTTVWHFPTAVG